MNYFHECSSTPDNLKETMGERLARTLRRERISHSEMAEHLGVHRNTVGGYCTGKSKPLRVMLHAWANRVDVPVEWIITGVWPEQTDTATTPAKKAETKKEVKK